MLFTNKVRIATYKTMYTGSNHSLLRIISCTVFVCRIASIHSHKRSLKVVLFIVTGAILKVGYKTEQKPHNNNDE